MRESTEGVSVGVLGVAVLGVVGAGPTTALRLGAWGAGVGSTVATCAGCVARVFHVKHDVYRVAGWMWGNGGSGK